MAASAQTGMERSSSAPAATSEPRAYAASEPAASEPGGSEPGGHGEQGDLGTYAESVASRPPLRANQGTVCRGFCFGAAMQMACAANPHDLEDDFLLEANASATRPAALPSRARIAELEKVLEDAQRGGLPQCEVSRAREALLALEAEGMRSHASLVVEEAIVSGDFWQLQAAMQTAASCGLVGEQLARLKEAMRAPAKHALRGQQWPREH